MARVIFVVSVAALVCFGVSQEIGSLPGGKDDPDNPNYTRRPILGVDDGHDNPDPDGDVDVAAIPADATALLNCTTIEELERHHHHSCGVRLGYSTHHCHCDWGKCREHRAHSWCGCPWGKCHQDRPRYCKLVWKYCAHRHHHNPGVEPRNLRPIMREEDVILPYHLVSSYSGGIKVWPVEPTKGPTDPPTKKIRKPATTKAPTTAAPTEAPTTKAPTTKAPTTAAPTTTTKAPTTTAPTTAAPTHHPTHHPSFRCGPWGYTTFACICPMGSCYSRHRPHGYCGCPWGYCKNKRPDFCRYFWKFCPQPHCGAQEPVTPTIDVHMETPEPPKPTGHCGKYGVASDKCKCSWYKCYHSRPSGECGCPWGYCREDRPAECKAETPKTEDLPKRNHSHHHHHHQGHGGKDVDCGKYGVPSDKCKCSPHKCSFSPYRPSYDCGCPWGYCKEDRPRECKAETPNVTDLIETRPTHGYQLHDKCGSFKVATRECRCRPGNCRVDRASDECGCPWGQCDHRRPYACKWRGTEDHHHGPAPTEDNHHHGHHHHHHHHHPHHHHHHSESGSSESRSSESWESGEDDNRGPEFEDDLQADKLQMILYGAMGFLICSLGFLFMAIMFSMVMRRMRATTSTGLTYRNLATTPVELVRNPMEDLIKKPEDKEKLIQNE